MMETKLTVITPKMAEEWLTKNTQNRKVNKARLDELVRIIKQGNWQPTHQGIAFYENGALADGQHRLLAISQAGAAVEALVTYGLPKKAAMAIDVGQARNIRHQMLFAGKQLYSNVTYAVIRLLLANFNQSRHTAYEVDEYIHTHGELVDFIEHISTKKIVRGITTATIISALAVCSFYEDKDEIERFFDILLTGCPKDEFKQVDSMVIRFRNYLVETKMAAQSNGGTRKDCVMLTMRIFKAYIEGKVLTKFYTPEDFVYKLPNRDLQPL